MVPRVNTVIRELSPRLVTRGVTQFPPPLHLPNGYNFINFPDKEKGKCLFDIPPSPMEHSLKVDSLLSISGIPAEYLFI
jgi:hypothetical protein